MVLVVPMWGSGNQHVLVLPREGFRIDTYYLTYAALSNLARAYRTPSSSTDGVEKSKPRDFAHQ